jgi:RNA polymerase sigma factor (sigma-70 family)
MQSSEPGPPSPGPARGESADEASMPGAVSGKKDELVRFIEFYDREYHLVVRFIMNCGAGLTAAEDAAQDAFLDVWKLMSVTRKWADVADPRGWIRAVALNKYRRPPGRCQPLLTIAHSAMADTEDPSVSPVDLSVSAMQVIDALRSLEPELKAVMAFDLDGFTAAEAGRYLGLTDQQVRDRRKKARKILASRLGVMENERRRDR